MTECIYQKKVTRALSAYSDFLNILFELALVLATLFFRMQEPVCTVWFLLSA